MFGLMVEDFCGVFFLDGSLMIDCRLSWIVWFAGCSIGVDRFFMFFFWLYNIYKVYVVLLVLYCK